MFAPEDNSIVRPPQTPSFYPSPHSPITQCSEYSKEDAHFLPSPSRSHRVHYNRQYDWDFHLESTRGDIDASLVLPHYRARDQPIDHRMTMLVGSDSGAVKLKIVRTPPWDSLTAFSILLSSSVAHYNASGSRFKYEQPQEM